MDHEKIIVEAVKLVDRLNGALEATQDRVRENSQRLDDIEKRLDDQAIADAEATERQ